MRNTRKSGKVTLADVARAVGVSAITVSRALREPDKVSATLRQRIDHTIRELGYVPDPVARALVTGRTNIIGVIIPSVTNNVFADVLRAVYDVIRMTDFGIQLGNSRYSLLEEEKLVRLFLSQKPAGLIVAGVDQSEATRSLLVEASCPVVQIMEVGDDPIDMMVGFSHYEAARAATRHLIDRGYRRPAFVAARMDPRSQRRLQGFREETEVQGLFDETRIITTQRPSSVAMGVELFGELMSVAPDADAVLCNNDDLALGVLFEAQRRRFRVPDQLGICGFNDLEFCAVAEPSMTSVRTFRHEMGERAIRMLVSAIEGKRPEEALVDLGYEVVHRRSTR
ncbi:LacI family DNA-binding transcriptional regulator [Stappia sp. F7233]|uniref:LacI family DNA-binding transcriptional regulator n=1 Tax=Stappia albiluteola TaxID=2758565 RepID=A0A839AD32_9HYPH|nr:LacI family DNA-binding transcriptional regulator [Stappia albiluteola]